ncbi:MAG TPA: dihydrodipicolinate reductase C-terminal domain-containing protein, partial [Acetobacteraceae bacterium]|nr:dihydrodipicolinate reductase C-terminal domain-containing protein [Acetobacteraceae bacterium]
MAGAGSEHGMSLRIGIMGIAGRMGRLLAEEVAVAGAVVAGGTLRSGTPPAGIPVLRDAEALLAACDVAIDFTHASAASAHAAAAVEAGTPLVLGTSGLSPDAEAAVARAAERVPVVYAANFAPGVNLVLALAERMAAALPAESYDAEIVEMHHRQKIDAPS